MALIDKKILNPIRYHQDNANTVIGQASTMKALFDQGAEDLRVKLNGVIDELLATTGAQQIGIDPAKGLGNTLADALTNIKNYMNLGASGISATTIGTGSGNTVQSQLEWLLLQIQNVLLNQIPDGTITMQKLATALANTINGNTSNIGDLTALTTTEKTNLVGAVNELVSQSAQKPSMTTAPITLYVSTTGNDSNDGLTPATALRNIQTAIDKIPQVVNHEINIILASGTYDESILLYGYMGKGAILLKGGTILSNDYVLHQASSYNNVCTVVMTGINAKITTDSGFVIQRSLRTNLYHCAVPLSSEYDGVLIADGSRSLIENCKFENRGRAIHCNNSILLSKNNTGLLNQVGLLAISSTIMKEGTQPTGTTNEITTAGGVIR
ncbi:hypothetical protein [Acetoanaerobium noterae]|uniref:hypothetical protein n=1 Tax=Acetoanaerobium noterae TaxID=745369 RepID=UPI0028A77215|nr:hypothetical protein [Acetoanaerobium noterae]